MAYIYLFILNQYLVLVSIVIKYLSSPLRLARPAITDFLKSSIIVDSQETSIL